MNRNKYEEDQMRERLLSIIHNEGMTERLFAIKVGREPSNFKKIMSGERRIPRGFFADVLKTFPNINKEWLCFGEGNMYSDKVENTKDTIIYTTRPRLPKSMSEGHLVDYYEGEKRKLCQEKPIITQFADYDFTLILKNNRMSPKYERGDELAFKRSTIIEWGNDYLLDTSEGPKFKKIYDDQDSVRCVSYNKEEFPEFVVPKNLIYGYYRLVGALRIL